MKKIIILLLISIELIAQTEKKKDLEAISISDSLFTIAYYLAEDGNYNSAIFLYSKALALNPIDYKSFSNRGFCYFKLEDYNNAIKDWTKALNYNPNYLSYNNRGLAYYEMGDYDNALRDFDRSIHLNQEFFSAYYNKGRVFAKQNKIDEAIKYHDSAITMVYSRALEAEIITSKADILFSIKDYDSALKAFKKVITLNEDYSYTYARIGDIHRRRKQVGLAIKAYDKAISYESVYPLAYLYRGKMKMAGEYRNLEDSKKDLYKYVELEPEDPEVYNTLGVIALYLQETDYCEYLQKSCDRGDCELLNTYCK